ncbi:MAG: PIN domain-containing protein [Candidatus Pacearchaeota archaeon]|nr:PIN domain-containing protein [Candidatus Pacearchaeota archaeon]MDE1849074.1 hypothetical protein [Nanoarchaeota archaeon]
MKQVLLDTNFILTCLRQKIDFFEEIPLMGMEIIIPRQVVNEIKKLEDSREGAVREEASLSMKLLNRNKFTSVKLRRNNVDRGIIEFAAENPDVIIATLDKEIKDNVRNQKMVIRNMKRLEIR